MAQLFNYIRFTILEYSSQFNQSSKINSKRSLSIDLYKTAHFPHEYTKYRDIQYSLAKQNDFPSKIEILLSMYHVIYKWLKSDQNNTFVLV